MIAKLTVIILVASAISCCWAATNDKPKFADGLRALGFDTRLGEDTVTADIRPELRRLTERTEVDALFTETWCPLQNRLSLVAAKGTGAIPDVLLTRYFVNESVTELAVGEQCAALTILFSSNQQLGPLTKEADCENACRRWIGQVLKISEKETKAPLSVERKGDVYLVKSDLYKQEKRNMPYTWAESIRIALDSNGRWISISVNWHLSATGGMPAGGFFRTKGSWFDDHVTECIRQKEGGVVIKKGPRPEK